MKLLVAIISVILIATYCMKSEIKIFGGVQTPYEKIKSELIALNKDRPEAPLPLVEKIIIEADQVISLIDVEDVSVDENIKSNALENNKLLEDLYNKAGKNAGVEIAKIKARITAPPTNKPVQELNKTIDKDFEEFFNKF